MKCDKCKHDLSVGKSRCIKCGHWNHASAKSHDGETLSQVRATELDRLISDGPWDPVFSTGGGIVKITSNFLAGEPGAGKCLGPNELVILYDGSRIKASDVVVGDWLMGPDSLPREVLNTTKGVGKLFRIVPIKGEPWICNEHHILTLVASHTGEVFDLPLHRIGYHRTDLKQFAVAVEFPPKPALEIRPYFLGIWFGDGSKGVRRELSCGEIRAIVIAKPDPEIKEAVEFEAAFWNLQVTTWTNATGCPHYSITRGTKKGIERNRLLDTLRKVVGRAQNLPFEYLTASRTDRLEFLAGLLDTDGYMTHGGFEIAQKRKGIADDICFLAQSLGFKTTRAIKTVGREKYHRIMISGDCHLIPTRIPRKKAPVRRQVKNVLRTGFKVEPIGIGEYAGFQVDGDGRFLLGDFTVTHNSTLLLQLASAVAIREKRPVLYISKEEAKDEVAARALRLGLDTSNITIVKVFSGSTRELLETIKPSMTILDSLQGLVGLGPGHLDEAAEVLTDLKDYAEAEKSPALVISHVTKEHDFAGEMALQHLVTATFMLATFKNNPNRRFLRARKNRHGDVSVGVTFTMTEKGLILQELPDSTELDKKVEESSKTSVYSSRKRTP